MSRHPNPNYGYPVSRAFYYDPELPEYADSDVEAVHPDPNRAGSSYAWHQGEPGPNTDVSELYRRKGQPPPGQYMMAPPHPSEYYYPSNSCYRPRGVQRMSRMDGRVQMERPVTPQVAPRPVSPMPPGYYGDELRSVGAQHWECWPQNQHMPRPSTTSQMARRSMHPSQGPENPTQNLPPRTKTAVSVRTPRFYRRPVTSDTFRRASALCLHGASQPDPGRCARPRSFQMSPRSSLPQPSQGFISANKLRAAANAVAASIGKQQASTSDLENADNSIRGDDDFDDLGPKGLKMKALLDHYQKAFEESIADVSDDKSVRTKCSKSSVNKYKRTTKKIFPHLLKPKLPPSLIKTKQVKKQMKESPDTSNAEEEKLDIPPITTEAFDRMLNEFEIVPSRKASEHNVKPPEKKMSGRIKLTAEKDDAQKGSQIPPDTSPSLNYAELSQFMHNHHVVQTEKNEMDQQSESSVLTRPGTAMQEQGIFNDNQETVEFSQNFETQAYNKPGYPENETSETSMLNQKKKSWTSNIDDRSAGDTLPLQRVPYAGVDDHSAIEIHQSKSYIVNLIDRALSREFRTLPEDRTKPAGFGSVEQVQFQPQLPGTTASGTLTTHLQQTQSATPSVTASLSHSQSQGGQMKLDQELSLEIKQVLAETLARPSQTSQPGDHKENSITNTEVSVGEESLCIKQLKKLRYGHMKHIQQEMRKLEDLERFIDSYSSNDPGP